MKDIRKFVMFMTVAVFASVLMFAILPQTAFAESGTESSKGVNLLTKSSSECKSDFLGFPAWYRGLTDDKCNIKMPSSDKGGLSTFIWTIAINCLDIALMFVGYLSVGYVIYGGFLMFSSLGNSSEIAEAQKTVRNAVIGLVIAFGSVAVVSLVAKIFTDVPPASGGDISVLVLPADQVVARVLNIVYTIAGIAAVLTIVIGGYTYVISSGNPSEIEKSKNTILYAVVGLIIIGFAFVITQFVIGRFQ
jgi:hypothetical protein